QPPDDRHPKLLCGISDLCDLCVRYNASLPRIVPPALLRALMKTRPPDRRFGAGIRHCGSGAQDERRAARGRSLSRRLTRHDHSAFVYGVRNIDAACGAVVRQTSIGDGAPRAMLIATVAVKYQMNARLRRLSCLSPN